MILGYAGLLPQVAAVAITVFDPRLGLGAMFAFGYAALILSFLGGIWWGFAMQAAHGEVEDRGQGRIAGLAVAPPLVASALILLTICRVLPVGWALVLMGVALFLTLRVDRWLATTGVAPKGWLAMRGPLSIGLGLLTIACGLVA
ncbi:MULTISPECIES: DUF3429 domain-containing protein [unclassified Sphingomonas]|uniref:DUF3429 domain-containing protein n=1 Tax=unclassified Sphingomonas TaxID=196159 RepID=UPI001E58D3A5|nr:MULTISPECIES: DUF3429 domain-containing protein [unclassified Sphingomonas]